MSSRPVDLEDRLVGFAATVCKLAERFPRSLSGRHVAQQLIRSATSPFANYGEARAAQSRRDFIHKMRVCLKELRESMTWLKFTDRVGLTVAPGLSTAIDECDQLIAIFVTSIRTAEAGDGRRGTDPR